MNKIFTFLLFNLVSLAATSQPVPAPFHLRTDLLLQDKMNNARELGIPNATINTRKPHFSWQADTSLKQATAFRILVAGSASLLVSGKADYWDSKKIVSHLTQVAYGGKPLEGGKKYYWKVQDWNEKGKESVFSETASFQMSDQLLPDTISHYPLTFELQQPEKIIEKQAGNYFLDFGKDAFCQLQLHLDSEKDDTLIIEAGEMVEKDSTVSISPSRNIRYIKIMLPVTKGARDYTVTWPKDENRDKRNPIQMPGYIGEVFPFRYVSVKNFPGSLNKSSVQRKMIHYPFDENASSFESSDTVLNQVWDLCKYSVKATSFTGFYVDGDRERLPYEADAIINQLSHYATDAEYSMGRRTMAYLLFNPTWPTEWSLQNVILAWNDYMYTGDDSFIKKYYAELQAKTLMPLAGPDGLISTRSGKQTDAFLDVLHKKDFDGRHGLQDIVDWPQNGVAGNEKEYPGETDGFVFNQYNAVVNAFYYHALMLMQKISAVLHKENDAIMYGAKAKQVLHSYQRVFRDAGKGLIKDGDSTSHTSLHSNIFALDFGLVPDSDVPKVISFIKSRRMACSVYGSQFLLDALYDNGAGQYALELMSAKTQRSWHNMIRSGSTISLEAWDKLYKPNLDMNHAWGSAPANIIIRKLMGVEPLTPGFESIRLKPAMGNLSFAKMKTSTIKGEVSVSYQKNKNSETWRLSIPGTTTANVYLPFNAGMSNLVIDGKTTTAKPQKGFWFLEKISAGSHYIEIK